MEKLTTYPILALPTWSEPFTLHTDASELAAGAVLTQSVENREAPVGYTSKRCRERRRNYHLMIAKFSECYICSGVL